MSFGFQGDRGLILIEAELVGPSQTVTVTLVLDTGSTETVIGRSLAERLGFDLSQGQSLIKMSTASDIVEAPTFLLPEITAMGQLQLNMSVVAYDMPSTAMADGVLGLNFFRRMKLIIDFNREELILE